MLYLYICSLAVNCIYWEKRFPRLLSTKQLQELKKKGCPLVGISDMTCDVGGSLEFINRTTSIDSPFFRFHIIKFMSTSNCVCPCWCPMLYNINIYSLKHIILASYLQ